MREELTEMESRVRVDRLEHEIRRLSMQLKIKKRALQDMKPVEKESKAKK